MDGQTDINTLKKELEIARSQIEHYTRAARIEAALEKVRASSLAMRHTSELQEVINTVGRQFRSLEINNTGGVFVIINEELDHDLHVWGFGDTATYSRKVQVRAIDRPIHTHLLNAIKNRRGFLAEAYSREEKVEYFKHLFQHPPYNETSEEHQNQWLNRSGGYTRSGFISDHTTLFMINHHGVPFSEEENQILIRFAHVFEQSYIRFLDLKKAEQQAREAQIEAALERIRARTMAMRDTREFKEVVNHIFDGLEKLNYNPVDCTIINFASIEGGIECWSTVPTEEGFSAFEYTLNAPDASFVQKILKAHQAQYSDWQYVLEGEEKESFDRTFFNAIRIPELEAALRSIKSIHANFSFNSESAIAVFSVEPMQEKDLALLRRFSQVVNHFYTRFLDLQNAERQAREAQIEAALEKVRSSSMAMYQSSELPDVALTLVNQLSSLGISHLGMSIIIITDREKIIYDQFSAHEKLDGNGKYLNRVEDMDGSSLSLAKEIVRHIDHNQVDFSIPLQDEVLTEFMVYTRDKIDHERGTAMLNSNLNKIYFHIAVFHNYSNIAITTLEPLPDEDRAILRRMADTFGQSYLRYKDLQKAEAQAREAQIDAALERIRAASMAMHKSEDLPAVALTFFNQIEQLGILINAAAINLVKESTASYQLYFANKHEIGVTSELDIGDFWLAKESFYRLKKGEKEFTITCEGDKLKAWLLFLKKEISEQRGAQLEKANLQKSYIHTVQFHKLSNTIFSAISPLSDPTINVLKRMTQAFGMSYIRFLDLQKAEERAREAQIEAALERVRTASMIMQHSDQLPDVAVCLLDQFEELAIPSMGVSITLLNPEDWSFQSYFADNTLSGSKKLLITPSWPGDTFWMSRESTQRYLQGEKEFSFEAEGARIEEWIAWVEKYMSKERAMRLRSLNLQKVYFHSVCYHDYNNLVFSSLQPMQSEFWSIVRRLAHTFGQSYRRFLDLQKAEEQAREAQIEAALERVRASSMSMQKSDELIKVATDSFHQLVDLNIETFLVYINFIDYEQSQMDIWYSVTENINDSLLNVHMPVTYPWQKKLVEEWKKGEAFGFISVTGEENVRKFIDELDAASESSAYSSMNAKLQLNTVEVTEANFKYGKFCICQHRKSTPEERNVITRFANVFEQCYTRFLDLQKAEAQARESQVEAALERVRSQTMAMQSSHDIGISVTSLFESLVDLGISEKVRCGIGILNHEDTYMDVWTASSNTDHKVILSTGQIDMSKHPLLVGARNSWKNQDRHFRYTLKDEDLVNYHQIINQSARYPTKIDVATLPQEIIHYSFVFDHGLLYAFADAPLPMDVMQILERLSTVFEHTYTRFLDLQRAELREKEAIKQASLDRIRAETASMRTARDLDQIIPLIWRELMILSIPFIRCGVFIMDEEDQIIHNYLSTPDGQAIASFQLPYDTPGTISQVLSSWRDKEIFIDYWDRSAMIDFANILVNTRIFSDPEEYLQSLPKEGFHLYFLPFLQGMLYVGNTTPLNPDQIDLLQAVSNAFSNAYARFEDFKKLEIAKAQVDQALQNLKDAQQQLIHAEKMASLGELTAGIAHEIQNPLNFVNNFSEIGEELVEEIKEVLKENDVQAVEEILTELTQNLQKIHHHGERASGIVRGMLDHSRAKSDDKTPTDINQLCDEFLRLAYHGLRAKDKSFQADFSLEADTQIPTILVSSQDIGRVLLNLINNGFQATIDKSRKDNNYKPQLKIITKKQSDSIIIQVQDNGAGIPIEIKEKIFQPFFTTKPTGQGTGLGLSLAYDIMKAHGGEIRVNSEPGQGTEFTLKLPIPK